METFVLQQDASAGLRAYIDGLDPTDRYLHLVLGDWGVLPALPPEIWEQILEQKGQWGDDGSEDAAIETNCLGITPELLSVTQGAEVTLLLLPGFWDYLRQVPAEWKSPDSGKRLAGTTSRLLGVRVSPRDGAQIARGRAETTARILRERLEVTKR